MKKLLLTAVMAIGMLYTASAQEYILPKSTVGTVKKQDLKDLMEYASSNDDKVFYQVYQVLAAQRLATMVKKPICVTVLDVEWFEGVTQVRILGTKVKIWVLSNALKTKCN